MFPTTKGAQRSSQRLALGKQRFPAASQAQGQLSAVITRLISKCMCSGWKRQRGFKEITPSSPVDLSIFVKENLDRKKTATDVEHLTKAKVRQVIFVETVIHVKEDFIDFFQKILLQMKRIHKLQKGVPTFCPIRLSIRYGIILGVFGEYPM